LGGILLLAGSILLYRMLKKWKYDIWYICLKFMLMSLNFIYIIFFWNI
jgi:hypothetical protein